MSKPHESILKDVIHEFRLEPHIEGGYFRELYRSAVGFSALESSTGVRSLASHIYYLLPGGGRSRLHVLDGDEIFHHYAGGPMTIVELTSGNECRVTKLGSRWTSQEIPSHLIRAGTWFGAHVDEGFEYSLVGCTVIPAFDFRSFRLGERDELLGEFPQHERVITWLI